MVSLWLTILLTYDAVFNLLTRLPGLCQHDPTDEDGELDFMIYYPGLDALALAVQDIVTLPYSRQPQGLAVVKPLPPIVWQHRWYKPAGVMKMVHS
jgi:hypothetical protein